MNLNIRKKDFIWNMVGTITYSSVSMIISIIIIRIIGADIGGAFSFGYSTFAQTIFTISYFGVRSFHVVDVTHKYDFNTYHMHRLLTCFIAIIIGLIYLFVSLISDNYSISKFILLFMISTIGMFEGYYDVYECEMQRNDKLYMVGQGLFFRIIVFVIVITTTLLITKNIFISTFIAILSRCLVAYFLIYKRYINYSNNKILFFDIKDNKKIIQLTKDTYPIFISIFLDMYLHSASKYAIDIHLTDYYSGLYNILFMPSNIIYLICSFAIRPLLTPLSNLYNENINLYKNDLNKIIKTILFICIFIFVVSAIFGILYLRLINIMTNGIYINDINEKYIYVMFLIIMLGSMFYAMSAPIYYALVIEDKTNYLKILYIVLSIVAFLVTDMLVHNFGFMFASISYLIIMIIMFLCFIFKEKFDFPKV